MTKPRLQKPLAKAKQPDNATASRSRASNASRSTDLSGRAMLISGAAPNGQPTVDGQRVQLTGIGDVWFNPGQPLRPIAQDASRQMITRLATTCGLPHASNRMRESALKPFAHWRTVWTFCGS